MRIAIWFVVSLLAATGEPALARRIFVVGVAQRTFLPEGPYNWRGAKTHALMTSVWYPADSASVEKPQWVGPPNAPLFATGAAAPDARPAAGKDGGDDAPGQFRGEKRSNETHESKTDPETRLYRKGNGQEAKLGYLGHVLMENRHGLIVNAMLTQADGTAVRDAALLMLYQQWRSRRQRRRSAPMSLGADKAYDTHDFVATVRDMDCRPHVTQNVNRPGGSAIDGRTTRHESYRVSQKERPWIEKAFGWMKQTGGMRKTKLRGLAKVAWQFLMTAAAFNLWRLPKVQAAEV